VDHPEGASHLEGVDHPEGASHLQEVQGVRHLEKDLRRIVHLRLEVVSHPEGASHLEGVDHLEGVVSHLQEVQGVRHLEKDLRRTLLRLKGKHVREVVNHAGAQVHKLVEKGLGCRNQFKKSGKYE